MPPVKYTHLKEDTEGNFGGVGSHQHSGRLPHGTGAMEGTPAEAGVIGDRFVKIEGENARNISMQRR